MITHLKGNLLDRLGPMDGASIIIESRFTHSSIQSLARAREKETKKGVRQLAVARFALMHLSVRSSVTALGY
jgi:hypothetical protein